MITNWTLEARLYEIAPEGNETNANRTARLANSQAYTDAVTTLQGRWTATYADAYRLASAEEEKARDLKKKKCEHRRYLYAELRDAAPQPEISAAAAGKLHTRAQVTAAMQTPLFFLPKEQRIETWVRLFTSDVFATFFEMSREVVDVR